MQRQSLINHHSFTRNAFSFKTGARPGPVFPVTPKHESRKRTGNRCIANAHFTKINQLGLTGFNSFGTDIDRLQCLSLAHRRNTGKITCWFFKRNWYDFKAVPISTRDSINRRPARLKISHHLGRHLSRISRNALLNNPMRTGKQQALNPIKTDV